VINAGWDHNQALISLSYDKLIDPAERWRSTPTVIADDAKRASRRKQAVHEEAHEMLANEPKAAGDDKDFRFLHGLPSGWVRNVKV
jgi:hypothetical protein